MIDGIFWDNAGVFMETEHLYYQANAEALAQAGVELTLDEFCRISLQQGESVLNLAAGSSDTGELRRVTSAARAGLAVAAIPGSLNQGGDFGAARWMLERIHELPQLLGLDEQPAAGR